MKVLRKLCLPVICFISLVCVLLSSKTNAKYYSEVITQVWKTNFTLYGEVNPDNVKFRYTIDAQSADNPPSMFDGNDKLNYNDSKYENDLKNRWTNWSDSGTNKGEDARIVIGFVKPVYVTAIRLYYFVDSNGCDIPRDLSLSYVDANTKQTVSVINDVSLENLNNSFTAATDRTSIFRTQGSGLAPRYYDKATGANYDCIQMSGGTYIQIVPPYTTIHFKDDKSQVAIDSFEISMQAGDDWYIGLTEMAIDWIFTDCDPATGDLSADASPWYNNIN